jgi:vanillate/3-O-methylgallate O-demethylase
MCIMERQTMTDFKSLEDKIQALGNPIDFLRNAPVGAYPFPFEAEYTNWRDEQTAWSTTAVLFDQSFHMFDIYFKGPDVKQLFSDLGVNTFKGFGRGKAKQFVACNDYGMVIADGILFGLEHDEYNLVGTPVASNWVQYHAETGDYDVAVTRDEASVFNAGERLQFRFQLNGPLTQKIVEKAHGRTLAPIPFFRLGEFDIAGVPVRALNHTMAGMPGLEMTGLEITGPVAKGPAVKDALMRAGEEFGLRLGGSQAYTSVTVESGWLPMPVPAIYSGEAMRPYREWLSGSGFEANMAIGGSFDSDVIDDYYTTPWDLGYARTIKFDHDFVGRAALEAMADEPHRRKVWLRWNDDDVAKTMADSLFGKPHRTKYMHLPCPVFSVTPYDKIIYGDRIVGISNWMAYTTNVGSISSIAMIDEADAVDGREVTVIWGEPDGGSAKPLVERHVQTDIRATISTAPLV